MVRLNSYYYRSINEAMFLDEAKLNELPALSRVVALSFSDKLIDDYNYLPVMHFGNICTPVCNNYKREPCFLVEMVSDCDLEGSPVFIYPESVKLVFSINPRTLAGYGLTGIYGDK